MVKDIHARRAHEGLLRRIRAEYLEMPGLRLTLLQAQRLFGLSAEACETLLNVLVAHGFLVRGPSGAYGRPTDGDSRTGRRQTFARRA